MKTIDAEKSKSNGEIAMTDVRIVRDYLYPAKMVWRVLTDQELIAQWGMRPEGFSPVIGTRFKFVAKPKPRWRGFVECVVLEAREPTVLRYSWVGDEKGASTSVKFTLEPHDGGTRLICEHTGFTGISGFLFARLMMGPGWSKMLRTTIPAVLANLNKEEESAQGRSARP